MSAIVKLRSMVRLSLILNFPTDMKTVLTDFLVQFSDKIPLRCIIRQENAFPLANSITR